MGQNKQFFSKALSRALQVMCKHTGCTQMIVEVCYRSAKQPGWRCLVSGSGFCLPWEFSASIKAIPHRDAARESSLQETWARSHALLLMIQHLLQAPEILTFMFSGWQLSILPESSLGASHSGMTTGRGFSQHLHKLCQQDSADHNIGVHVMVTPMYSVRWCIWWATLRGRGVLGLVNSRKGFCCGLKALLATSYILIALIIQQGIFLMKEHISL